ncbi:type II toxin-antitoxin system antitoxin DNA ADP-ribosyl glycohydrolase DarG [Salipiger profundus]|uniref:type II toxin-antitoxin system antitoxin DNA ADP-ribosyl glycohydrolase DarG n=1 Tax=Salipiger profundus TaxID=1229727 RepID=UPI0008E28A91|nr:macro domain-containing protein [Salipiger profundus]SFC10645.1 O-acetyl-ADP-ribose deacetylase (regulator of RNase III), contains Macro domain [Salipiger profundus]
MTLEFTEGNLLEADTEALVNTVNTVGVMGKGVALMFKEAFPENFVEYKAACRAKELQVGKMFVTHRRSFLGPTWIINFPTKAHWRYPSKMEWVDRGLDDLKDVILRNNIKSIALPPLGAGNGGLEWTEVKRLIVEKLEGLNHVHVVIYEPTRRYQNVAKRSGVEKLTGPRASVAELIRQYSILGIECSLLEVQKLGYFLERFNRVLSLPEFRFDFSANKFGPYSDKLKHMLNGLDGSYLHCDKRLSDAGPFEPIRFDEAKAEVLELFMRTEGKSHLPAVEATSALIDGFESPLSMELLSTVDWLIVEMRAQPDVHSIRRKLLSWPGGEEAADRKLRLFEDREIKIALDALKEAALIP